MSPASRMVRAILPVLVALLAACRANTTRPSFVPVPEAMEAEVRLGIATGTQLLTEAPREDSLPIARVEEFDGYVETPWFTLPGFEPTTARPAGRDVMRVRGWVNPARPGYVRLVVEVVYRPWIDPGRPGRDLDRAVPADHPVPTRIRESLDRLLDLYGPPDHVRGAAVPR